MVSLLSLDPQTMLIMIVVSSFLQAGVLIALDLVANQYKGISIYMLAAIAYALGVGVALSPLTGDSEILQFLGNLLLIVSKVLIALSVREFLGKRTNLDLWGLTLAPLVFIQYYYIFFDSNYIARNIGLLLINVGISLILIKSVIQAKTHGFLLTSRLMLAVFGVDILFSLIRGLLLLDGESTRAIDASLANNFSWLILFFIDLLRNSFFVLMVSRRMYSELKEISEIDFLSQVFNRGALITRLEMLLKRQKIYPLSLILLDIDHFKKINDTYGHDVGDLTLKTIVELLKSQLQPWDLIGRWGGEEFLIVLSRCSASEVGDRAESMRRIVEKTEILYGTTPDRQLHCRVSLGVVTANSRSMNLDKLIKQADLALYQAKENGRNRVEYSVVS